MNFLKKLWKIAIQKWAKKEKLNQEKNYET